MITDEEYNPITDADIDKSVVFNKVLTDEEFNPSETLDNEEVEEIDEITLPKDKEPKIETEIQDETEEETKL